MSLREALFPAWKGPDRFLTDKVEYHIDFPDRAPSVNATSRGCLAPQHQLQRHDTPQNLTRVVLTDRNWNASAFFF